MRNTRRNFKGNPILVSSTLTHEIELALRDFGPSTAWQVAKLINAFGSSVSSCMFKMRQRGELIEVGTRTAHGGRLYRLPTT